MTSPLIHRADALAGNVATLMKSPAAFMLPAPARQVIRDLAELVQLLAVEVEKCKAGTP